MIRIIAALVIMMSIPALAQSSPPATTEVYFGCIGEHIITCKNDVEAASGVGTFKDEHYRGCSFLKKI